MTTAMEIDTKASALQAEDSPPFSLESLEEPLQTFYREAQSVTTENAATKYDALETQLRTHLLQLLVENPSQIYKDWTACWNLCKLIIEHHSSYYDRFIRKLPFVLLEDLVETMPLRADLEQFYSSLDMSKLCSGVLWESPQNQSHVLQYIRFQNALLKRLSPEYAGSILMDMAKTLPLSDRSALKLWGSVSGRTVDIDDEEETTTTTTSMEEQDKETTTTAANANFHQVFWSVQHSMANPYSISFQTFFQNCKTILATLESSKLPPPAPVASTSTNSIGKYLTKRSLLPLQLQDATFVKQWLIQFLIIESFCSWQSQQLKVTLADLSNRAKALLRKLSNGPALFQNVQHTLTNSEAQWRQWKRSKCKPDMEIMTTANDDDDDEKKQTPTDSTLPPPPPPPRLLQQTTLTMQDLQETCKTTMAIPQLREYLEPYVDALDPEAGIEAEYHPRNDKSYCWRSLRLLARQHLHYFSDIFSNGDFERMVRKVYSQQYHVDIPGDVPKKELDKDYDEKEEEEEEEEGKDEVKEDEMMPHEENEDAVMEDAVVQDEEATADEILEPHESQTLEDKTKIDMAEAPVEDVPESVENEEAVPVEPKQNKASEVEEKQSRPETPVEPAAGEVENDEPNDTTKVEMEENKDETEPLTPLNAFEEAAMEEEAILIAEEEEKAAAAAAAAKAKEEEEKVKSEAKDNKSSDDTKEDSSPKKETKPSTRDVAPEDDRKRKRDISDASGSRANDSTTKRTRGNEGSTSNDYQSQQRRQDNRSHGGRGDMRRDDDHARRRGSWGGRASGGVARGDMRGPNARPPPPPLPPPPPPPPPPGGPQHQGGRGRGPGRGRGSSQGGRGSAGRGDDGRYPPRRDSRRRY